MLFFQDSKIESIAVHKVGNKSQDEFYQLSDRVIYMSDYEKDNQHYIKEFFISPFYKTSSVFRLSHPSDELKLNEVYYFVRDFLNGPFDFKSTSENLAKHLYEVSNHPKIRAGEFFTVYFKNIMFEGEYFNAIGLYKSDNKEAYVEVNNIRDGDIGFSITSKAVGLGNIGKAALIINKESEKGFNVLVADLKNISDKVYWQDEFLQVKPRNDNFYQTSTFMKLTKSFINEKLEETFEMGKADKADLLNKTVKYLKENETVSIEEFSNDIFANPSAAELFNSYLSEGHEIKINESFEISNKAVKKSEKSFKSVLKLDKNFHLYVHGKRDYLERGFDEEKGMNFYKVYFEKES